LSKCCDSTSGQLNQIIQIPERNHAERAEENTVGLAKCFAMETDLSSQNVRTTEL
jgi:hypothetical protein